MAKFHDNPLTSVGLQNSQHFQKIQDMGENISPDCEQPSLYMVW